MKKHFSEKSKGSDSFDIKGIRIIKGIIGGRPRFFGFPLNRDLDYSVLASCFTLTPPSMEVVFLT
jgi:hypothetical protein